MRRVVEYPQVEHEHHYLFRDSYSLCRSVFAVFGRDCQGTILNVEISKPQPGLFDGTNIAVV